MINVNRQTVFGDLGDFKEFVVKLNEVVGDDCIRIYRT
jgi:hypothetical protein